MLKLLYRIVDRVSLFFSGTLNSFLILPGGLILP